jgi:hypothetical protein
MKLLFGTERAINWGDVPTWLAAIAGLLALAYYVFSYRLSSLSSRNEQVRANDLKKEEILAASRHHAGGLSVWAESGLLNPLVHLANSSKMPYTKIIILCTRKGATKPTHVFGSDLKPYAFRYLPSGEYKQALPEGEFDLEKEFEVHYSDSDGARWVRKSTGELEQSDEIVRGYISWIDTPQKS